MLQPVPLPAFGQDGPTFPAGEKLIVGVVNDPPYLMKGKDGEWTGFSINIWEAVAKEIKVPYEFKEMEFSKLIEALKENKIDVSIDGFFLLAEREKYMDFTVPLGSSRLAVATLPDKLDHPWIGALKILFSWSIMKIIVPLLMILCILGFLIWYIEREHNPEHFGGGFIRGVGSGIYWVGSTLASGSCFGISLNSLAARGLGLVWMLVCTLLISALTASLTTSLSASKHMASTVSDVTLRHMRIAGIKGSAEVAALQKMNATSYILYNTEEDALRGICNKEVDGYLYDEITLSYYRYNNFKDKIAVYPTNLRRFSFAYGLPKNSRWRTKINFALMKFMEKPDFAFLLSRYGIGQNFEEIPYVPFSDRGKWH